jgi:prepilin-type N-terminal cleavage/methylation domain-containing protein
MIYMKNRMRKGFTLIEFIVAVSLLAIVSGIAIRSLNPVGQLRSARNLQRTAHVNTIVNAIRVKLADTRTGVFSCAAGDIPTSSKKMASGNATNTYDIAPCLVPTYILAMPFDPSATSSRYVSNTDYDSGYFVMKNASTGQITVSAPSAELNRTISVTR